MAAQMALKASLAPKLNSSLSSKDSFFSSSTFPVSNTLCSPTPRPHHHQHFRVHAKLGGGQGDVKQGDKKKFITKEEEPEQYWQTAGEREGENPMKTPLPYIIIFGMSTPFIILAIAFLNGWIKVPVR